ncbi:MAG: hypothetical protein V1816_19700 [Pseudomonadota bacterium]
MPKKIDYAQAYGEHQVAGKKMAAKYPDKAQTTSLGEKTISSRDLPEGSDDQRELSAAEDNLAAATNDMFAAHRAAMSGNVGATGQPCPLAGKQGNAGRKNAQKKCPHKWVEKKRETPAATKAKNNKCIADKKDDPKWENQRRGWAFENKAIDAKQADGIEAAGLVYECEDCGAVQEMDMMMSDGQAVEIKSASASQAKNLAAQSFRMKTLQAQHGDPTKPPRAVLDGSRPDVEDMAEIYRKKGYEVEIVRP